jgi:hypothetical protein
VVKKLARLVSFVFHPLWIPTFLFAIIFVFTPAIATPINQEIMPRMLVLIFTLTGIIPLATLVVMRLPYFIMIVKLWARQLTNGAGATRSMLELRPQIQMVKKQSLLQSFSMIDRSDRIIPFFVITVFYLAVCVMMSGRLGWGSFFIIAMLTITFTSLVVSVITLFWKISVHSIAVSSLVGFLFAAMLARIESDLIFPLAGCIVIAGVVMSSRLYLNVHSPSQVGWGCLIGFLTSFVVTWVYF